MTKRRLAALGVAVPTVELPVPGVDPDRWGVVACDQYTAQPEYWEKARSLVGGMPSTLNMILPEAYLGTEDAARLEAETSLAMERYLNEGILASQGEGMILVERNLGGAVRTGLMVALDLECYDYTPGSTSLIRATERTIVERIPPRMEIRRRAALELPHIMVLIDDPEDGVMQAARSGIDRRHPLYRANLMLGGGQVSGYRVDEAALAPLAGALEALTAGQAHPMLFAMGDGNHSLAAAKAWWEELKPTLSRQERAVHPARYALAEVVNLHDKALNFEPIHRVIFHTDPERLLARLEDRLGGALRRGTEGAGCPIGVCWGDREEMAWLDIPAHQLPLTRLQPALDEVLTADEEQDFIHGADTVRALCRMPGRLGMILPPFDKAALFPTVADQGPLPRKSFSMGEAHEKRYYFECRRIRSI